MKELRVSMAVQAAKLVTSCTEVVHIWVDEGCLPQANSSASRLQKLQQHEQQQSHIYQFPHIHNARRTPSPFRHPRVVRVHYA